ncbi:AbrB/MazE/SpoVT family DNA-binding domain-containing protein [Methylobacterium oxalidis]|uniref:AbrB/MazE/SpoVT family DNA-binding domain-containing protein n=1 Tax=Methylobacterium oxalidis TaxID=944322 RepID=UPI00331522A4
MRHYAVTLTADGTVRLPPDFLRRHGLGPGDRLTLAVDEDGRATLARADDLSAMKAVARAARAAGATTAEGADPVGDYLLAEDARTKTRR